jgi:hypothetical protein
VSTTSHERAQLHIAELLAHQQTPSDKGARSWEQSTLREQRYSRQA